MVGQMILGFTLPFILTTVALPFESFVSSSRTVFGTLAVWFLRTLSFLLRLAGNLGFYMGRLVVNGYDLIIFPAIWVETLIQRKRETLLASTGRRTKAAIKRNPPMTILEEAVPCEKPID